MHEPQKYLISTTRAPPGSSPEGGGSLCPGIPGMYLPIRTSKGHQRDIKVNCTASTGHQRDIVLDIVRADMYGHACTDMYGHVQTWMTQGWMYSVPYFLDGTVVA